MDAYFTNLDIFHDDYSSYFVLELAYDHICYV